MPATTNNQIIPTIPEHSAFLVYAPDRSSADCVRRRTEAFTLIHKLGELQAEADDYLNALEFGNKSKLFDEWQWGGDMDTFLDTVRKSHLHCLDRILEIQVEIKCGGFAMETLTATHKESMLENRWTTGEKH